MSWKEFRYLYLTFRNVYKDERRANLVIGQHSSSSREDHVAGARLGYILRSCLHKSKDESKGGSTGKIKRPEISEIRKVKDKVPCLRIQVVL